MFRRALRSAKRLSRTHRWKPFLRDSVLPTLIRNRHCARPIFVMSPAGSGSTWIAAMLGHLPHHVFVHEVKLCGGTGGKVLLSLQAVRKLIPGRMFYVLIAAFERARLWTLDVHAEYLGEERSELMARENLKDLQIGHLNRRHFEYDVIDSAGSHIAIAPLLRKAYPNAILCFIVRDPRDVCASIKYRKPFGKDVPIDELAKVVMKDYQRCSKHRDACQIDILRYESWLGDAEGEMRAFVQRHGLEMPEQLLREAVDHHDATAMKAGKIPKRGNLQVALAGGWAQSLTANDKDSLRPILNGALVELGYYDGGADW